LRIKNSPYTLSFKIIGEQMYNSTSMMWVMFSDFGIDPVALQLKLDQRYVYDITKEAETNVQAGAPLTQMLFRRDGALLKNRNWAMLYQRVIYDENAPY
jgi:hypothetical protein